MKRYYSKLLPAVQWAKPAWIWGKKYYYAVLPVVACLVLVMVFRPWKTSASTSGGMKGSAMGRGVLVADRAPASSNPITYEYIMTEAQQKRVLREAPKLKVGDDVKSVIEKLGPPMKDDSSYGQKGSAEAKKHRALSYYFAKRLVAGANDFDPCVFIVFDENGKLFAMASNVSEIAEVNWGAGITAYNGVTH